MSGKQKKMLISIIIGLITVVGIVVAVMVIQTGMTDEAIEARTEAEKAIWGYDERVAEIAKLQRLETHRAESVLTNILEILEQTKVGPITSDTGMGGMQMEVEGLPIRVIMRGGEIHEIALGKAKVYTAQKDVINMSAEREYTLREYIREIGHLEKAFGVSRYEAHQSYQRLISASLYNITDIKKVRKEVDTYKGRNGEMDIILKLQGDRVVAAYATIEELEVQTVIFDEEIEEGTLRSITPMGGGRGNIGGGLEYQLGRAMGIDGATQIRMPIGLPDATDTWVIIETEGKRYIKVMGDIDEGKGMAQKRFLIKQDRESMEIEYLKINRKEYIK